MAGLHAVAQSDGCMEKRELNKGRAEPAVSESTKEIAKESTQCGRS